MDREEEEEEGVGEGDNEALADIGEAREEAFKEGRRTKGEGEEDDEEDEEKDDATISWIGDFRKFLGRKS
jgi:hypothetical protein